MTRLDLALLLASPAGWLVLWCVISLVVRVWNGGLFNAVDRRVCLIITTVVFLLAWALYVLVRP